MLHVTASLQAHGEHIKAREHVNWDRLVYAGIPEWTTASLLKELPGGKKTSSPSTPDTLNSMATPKTKVSRGRVEFCLYSRAPSCCLVAGPGLKTSSADQHEWHELVLSECSLFRIRKLKGRTFHVTVCRYACLSKNSLILELQPH